jgi:hypothetical protein
MSIEEAVWYLNLAAAAVLFVRLAVQRILTAHPFLLASMIADTLESLVTMGFSIARGFIC